MNILILNYEYPPLGGGAGVVSRFHAEGLANLGHSVTVITTWFEGEKEVLEKENLKIIKLKSKRKFTYKSNPIEMFSWAKLCLSYFKQNENSPKFDICMAHFAIPAGIPALMLKRKFKIPFIMISHGEDMPFVNKKRMLKYHIPLYPYIRRVCLKSEANIVLTNTLLSNINRLIGEKRKAKNTAIPNGCSPFFVPAKKQFDTFKILFVGRLQEVKQPHLFMQGLKILSQKGVNFEANIAGDGPELENIKDFAKANGFAQSVKFHGWVDKVKMLKLYQETHVQVMTSRFEAFSIAALEGLFCGTFLISTPVSGNTDIIEPNINGFIFPHENASVLAQLLFNFYQNQFKNKTEVSSAYIKEFRAKYMWANIIQDYEHLLLRILH